VKPAERSHAPEIVMLGTLRVSAPCARGACERSRSVRVVQRTCRTFDAGLWIPKRRRRVDFCAVRVAADFERGEGADERSCLVMCPDAVRDVRATVKPPAKRSPNRRAAGDEPRGVSSAGNNQPVSPKAPPRDPP
jgi:hypothetical protein